MNIIYDNSGTFLDRLIFIKIVDCYFLRFFFERIIISKKFANICCWNVAISQKNNNFVATVCLPHNFWTKFGQINRITTVDTSNSLSYEHIRKNCNEFEDIFTSLPPEFFWTAGNPPEGVPKYTNFFFRSMLYLVLIIEVVETF